MKVDIDFELERLRTEIRHLRGMYKIAEDESVGALKQVTFKFCGIYFQKNLILGVYLLNLKPCFVLDQ